MEERAKQLVLLTQHSLPLTPGLESTSVISVILSWGCSWISSLDSNMAGSAWEGGRHHVHHSRTYRYRNDRLCPQLIGTSNPERWGNCLLLGVCQDHHKFQWARNKGSGQGMLPSSSLPLKIQWVVDTLPDPKEWLALSITGLTCWKQTPKSV